MRGSTDVFARKYGRGSCVLQRSHVKEGHARQKKSAVTDACAGGAFQIVRNPCESLRQICLQRKNFGGMVIKRDFSDNCRSVFVDLVRLAMPYACSICSSHSSRCQEIFAPCQPCTCEQKQYPRNLCYPLFVLLWMRLAHEIATGRDAKYV